MLASAGPAAGQSADEADPYLAQAARTLNQVRKCQSGTGTPEEIVVCGSRGPAEPYRLPIRPDGFDPKGSVDSISRERHRLIQEGGAGPGSCSTVGPGGGTGCFHQQTKRRCEQDPCGTAF